LKLNGVEWGSANPHLRVNTSQKLLPKHPPLDVAKNLQILIGTLIGNRHDLNSSSRLDFLRSKSALADCLADKLFRSKEGLPCSKFLGDVTYISQVRNGSSANKLALLLPDARRFCSRGRLMEESLPVVEHDMCPICEHIVS